MPVLEVELEAEVTVGLHSGCAIVDQDLQLVLERKRPVLVLVPVVLLQLLIMGGFWRNAPPAGRTAAAAARALAAAAV